MAEYSFPNPPGRSRSAARIAQAAADAVDVTGRSDLSDHFMSTEAKLMAAKAMRDEHHNAVISALGSGEPAAMAGNVDNRSNEQESYDPAGPGRYGAWSETVSDFMKRPTD